MSNRSGINTGSKEKTSQFTQPKRQRTSASNPIVHPVSSGSSLQASSTNTFPVVKLEKYQLSAPEVVCLNQRIGHPDFFPLYSEASNETLQDKQKGTTLSKNVAPEDTFTLKSIAEGFSDPLHLQDEYGSMKNKLGIVNIHEMKGKALKSIKEIEWVKGMTSKKNKIPIQTQKKSAKFPSQIPCKKEFLDKWMQGLAAGEPLHKLAQRVPLGHKGDNLLQALTRERVPLLRATWLIKIIHQNNIQKKSELDLSIEWTTCLTSGLISNMKAMISNPDSLEKSKYPFLYVVSLMNWNFHEGLLNSETLFSRLTETFHDANKLEEISLLCCILTPYISWMTSSPQYAKQLTYIVMEKLKLVGDSQAIPEKLQAAHRYAQLDEHTLAQFIQASVLDILDSLRCMLHEILLQAPNVIGLFDAATKVALSKTLQIQPLNPSLTLEDIPTSAKLPLFALISPAITHGVNEFAFCANMSSSFLLSDRRAHPHLPYVDQLNLNIDFFQALEDYVRLVWRGPAEVQHDHNSPDVVDLRLRKLLEQYQLFGSLDISDSNLADFVLVICTWAITGDQGDDGLISMRTLVASSLLAIFVQVSSQEFPLQEPLNAFLSTPHAQSNIEHTVILVAQFIRRRLFSHDIFIRNLISRGIMEGRDLGFQKFSNYLHLIQKLPIAVEIDLSLFLHQDRLVVNDIEEQFQHLQNQRRSVLYAATSASELNEETNQITILEHSIEQILGVVKQYASENIAWFLKDDLSCTHVAQSLEVICRRLHMSSLYIRFSVAQRVVLIVVKRTEQRNQIPILPDELIILTRILSACEDWIALSQILCLALSITPVDSSHPLLWSVLVSILWFIKRYENVFVLGDLMETVLETYLLKSAERAKLGADMICCMLCSHFVQYLQRYDYLNKHFAEKFPQQFHLAQQLAQQEVVDYDVATYLSNFGMSLTGLDTVIRNHFQKLLSSSSDSENFRFEWLIIHLEAIFHGKYVSDFQTKFPLQNLVHAEVVNHLSSSTIASLLKVFGQQFGLEFVLPSLSELVSRQLPLKLDFDPEVMVLVLQTVDDVMTSCQVLVPLSPISFEVLQKPRSHIWNILFDVLAVPIMDTFFSERCTERIQNLIIQILQKPWFKQIWKSEKSVKYAISNFNKMSTLISSLLPNFKQPFQHLHQTKRVPQPHTLEFAATLANCTILNWKVNCLYLLALVHCPFCKAEQQANQADNRTKDLVVQIILYSMGLVLDVEQAANNNYSYKQVGQAHLSSQKHCVISCRVIRSIGINLPIHTTMFRVVDDILQSNLKTRETLLQTTLNLVKYPQSSRDIVGSKSEEFVSFVLSWLAICSSDLQLIRLFVYSLANQLRELVTSDRASMDDNQTTHVNECIAVRLQLLEPLLGFLKKGKSLDAKLIADIASPLLRFLQSATTDTSQNLRALINEIAPRLIHIFELLLSWTDMDFNSNQQLVEFREQFKVDYQEFAQKQRTNVGHHTAVIFALEETLPWLATDNGSTVSTSQSSAAKKRVLEDTWAMLEDVEDVPLSPCSVLGAVHVEKTKASSFYLHPV